MSNSLDNLKHAIKLGDFDKALAILNSPEMDDESSSEYHYLAAVANRYVRKFDLAEQHLKKLTTQSPGYARGLQELGHLYRDQAQYEAAIDYYRLATQINSALVASWKGLANCFAATGQIQLSEDAGRRALQMSQLPKPLRIAHDLLAEGKLARAEHIAREFLKTAPHHPEAMSILAEIGVQMGALEEALTLYKAIVQLTPSNLFVQFKYIQLLRKQNQFDTALETARSLKEKHPDDPQCVSVFAIELMQLGHYEAAIEQFDHVISVLPMDPTAFVSKAHALKTLGEQEQAVAAYRQALALNPYHGEAWYSLANLKTVRFNRSDVEQMESALQASRPLSAMDRVYLHFALGKAHEDQKSFESSFQHYRNGNALKKAQSRYSGAQLADEFEQMKAVFSSGRVNTSEQRGCRSADPIFVVGLPRAGSTLIEQILSSHSQIDGTLELPNILASVHQLRLQEVGYPKCIASLTTEELEALGRSYIEDTRIHRADAPFFIDKMPNNFRHIGLIKLMLPNAKIIDARRHPLDCCFSGYKQLFAEGQEFSYSLEDIGAYYREYVELMAFWHEQFPGEILQVNHEDLLDDFDAQVKRLLDYCGVEDEPNCYTYYKTQRAVRTASSEQVRQPINRSGVDRWKPYEKWLCPLFDEIGELVTSYRVLPKSKSIN